MRYIDIYIIDENKKVVGTVGWFYYSRLSIKELVELHKPYRLVF